ncbi:endonuclease/exonuclease/phosphatase [Actinomadura madurae]|uniref:endonuclease/exonuclease/phosphatase family protein n=1 Tax=Actinomadura madurae TaxID=1993 RepID=UPI00202659B5|nr:endonuclease/exonuclease/phosphatase family protein [Actinomadura madurae]URN10336.1 endonuclease/exonuclease/phosphatase [Actinomadura madurae]
MVHGLGALLAAAALAAPLLAAPAAHAAAPSPRIRDIQGAAHISPLKGHAVSGVPGVVTALTVNGFWMQDPHPDRSHATSEGVFVFTRTAPKARVGDSVRVDGRVSEFRPGGGTSGGLTRTEIDATATAVGAHGAPLPAPAVLGPRGLRPPGAVIERGRGNVERGGAFDPRHDAIDFYEALEGMRVRVEDAVAAGPTLDGELPVLPAGGAGARARTARGGILLRDGDANPERVILDDALAPIPAANVGDRLPGPSDGVLDYSYGDYRLLLTATPRRVPGGPAREATRPQRPGEMAVATTALNGLNPDAPPARFDAVARDIVAGLRSPDLVAVTGLGDNSGPDDDGTVADDQTVAQLITAISAAGGPAYDWRSVDPRDNEDGGRKGANDRVGFLFRTDRGLAFVDRPSPSEPLPDEQPEQPDPAVTSVRAVGRGGTAGLTLSPGRIAPRDTAWAGTRKPVAGELTWQGRRLIVIANQWFPRTGDDQPLFGRNQPPSQPTAWRRDAQARVVARFVNSVRRVDANASVIVAGDLNDRAASIPVQTLAKGAGLADLSAELPAGDRYTAVTAGNSEDLDHIMLSASLHRRRHEFDVVHRSAEFADRAGERDPTVVRIAMSGK